ncbi:hypothetical protein B0I35DRAFT_262843 [Stachybotrys elegans]|uniref:Uncharacterized protein n=1 Tax=Stachybotrys elegans TaxID=80388 RepID=A0A8K0SUU0_9HYPO|nr:hypothetical protein B0I35DRAFT_262843 [Stachybotrys elegans]
MAPKSNSSNHKPAAALNGLTNGVLNGHSKDMTMSEAHFNDVMKFFTTLYLSKSFVGLKGLSTENDQLKDTMKAMNYSSGDTAARLGRAIKECDDIKERLTKNEEEQKKVKAKHEEEQRMEKEKYDELNKECEELKKQREDDRKELARLGQVSDDYDKLKVEHAELLKTTEILDRTLEEKKKLEEKLKALEGYSFKLSPGKNLEADLTSSLKTLVETATQFARTFLFHDLEPEVFYSNQWQGLKSHDIMGGWDTHLPATNSLLAKQMRFAAGLNVLGSMLHKYIFQTIYLDGNGNNQVNEFLSVLCTEDGDHEQYVRSVLFNALPDRQDEAGVERAYGAALEVMDAISVLVPLGKREDCRKQLGTLCKDALQRWVPFQRLQDRVSSSLDCENEDGAQWRVLQMPPTMQPKEPAKGSDNQKGNAKSSGKGQQQKKSAESSAEANRFTCAVWPKFCFDGDMVQAGLALTEDQMRAAEEEAKEEMVKRRTSRVTEEVLAEWHQRRARSSRRDSMATSNGDVTRQNGHRFLGNGIPVGAVGG